MNHFLFGGCLFLVMKKIIAHTCVQNFPKMFIFSDEKIAHTCVQISQKNKTAKSIMADFYDIRKLMDPSVTKKMMKEFLLRRHKVDMSMKRLRDEFVRAVIFHTPPEYWNAQNLEGCAKDLLQGMCECNGVPFDPKDSKRDLIARMMNFETWNDAASQLKPFSESNFKKMYTEARAPNSIDDVFFAIQACVVFYCEINNIPQGFCSGYLEKVAAEVMANRENEAHEITAIIWTTAIKLVTSNGNSVEFSNVLNLLIRLDEGTVMRPVCVIARSLNLFCNGELHMEIPEIVYRGTRNMPVQHRDFFVAGMTYRTNQYCATSKSKALAKGFLKGGNDHTLFIIYIPKNCRHVNYLEKLSAVENEQEFLFPPYSVFIVMHADYKRKTSVANPHIITLQAAEDNRVHPENLPVAPWC
jgi:hypothetical protein